jgi:hypothetical protein
MVTALDAHFARAFDQTFEVGLSVRRAQRLRWKQGGDEQKKKKAGEEGGILFHYGIDF